MLRLRGVVKRYGGFTAVAGLDLEVARGEIFGFLGPNGAGKTTTIRMVAGVLRPTEGRIHLGGDDLVEEPEKAKARLGYIPDRPYLYEKLSGGEFLRFVAGLWGQDGE
jgi:ABC-2 type transport system ATP-binding protein